MIPDISVIMSINKNEEYRIYKNAIFSILSQSFTNFEFIIVLDGNPYLKLPSDKRIKIIKNDENEGLASSLNKAISISRGVFIARQDADDISIINRLQIQYDFLINNYNIDLVGSDTFLFDLEGNILGRRYTPLIHKDLIQSRYSQIEVPHPTWMCRKSWLDNIGGYKNLKRGQDQYLLITNCKKYRYYNISKPRVYYRIKKMAILSTIIGRISTVRANFDLSIWSFFVSFTYHFFVFFIKDVIFSLFGNKIYQSKTIHFKDLNYEQSKLNNLIKSIKCE